MSSRSGHHQEYLKHHHPQDHGRAPARRPAAHHAAPAAASGEGYTLVHAGKQVRFGPVVFWIAVGTVVLLGMWSAATATYFAFRDDVLTRLIARQAEMQYAYEDRISELRAKVDRTTSRQLLDQEQFDQKLDQIMKRQSTLESRATALGAMPDATSTGSIKPQGRAESAPSSGTPKPSPISDTVIFVAPPDREARLESRAPLIAKTQPNQFAKAQGVDNVLVRLQTSLDQVERRQVALRRGGRADQPRTGLAGHGDGVERLLQVLHLVLHLARGLHHLRQVAHAAKGVLHRLTPHPRTGPIPRPPRRVRPRGRADPRPPPRHPRPRAGPVGPRGAR